MVLMLWLKKFQSCESEASTLQIHTLLFRVIFVFLFGTLQEKQNLQVPAWFQTGATIISFCFPNSMDEEMDMSSDLSFTAPSDVECSSCTGSKRKAEKTCLQCLASYCEDHLDIHNDLHTNAKRHKMVAATGRLEERVCPEHDKLMEVFCRTDQQCICHLCITNKHRAHDVVSIDYEVAEVKVGIFLKSYHNV